jgi:hypothetical protein
MLTRFAIVLLACGTATPVLAQRETGYPAGSIFFTPVTPPPSSSATPGASEPSSPALRSTQETSEQRAQEGSSRARTQFDVSTPTAPILPTATEATRR